MPTAANIGLGNVDNTSDANKPVSTATAAALGGKVNTGAVSSSGLTMATARLLGRSTSGSGAVEEITLGTNLSFSGTTLNATGGGGSPGGSSGQIQWNSSGSFDGVSTTSVDGSGNLTFTGRWIQSTNGAASAPPMSLTGTWFTGGTSTTTKPQLLIEPAGTTSTGWSTAGTGLGVNCPSGFVGNLLDLQVNGASKFRVTATGQVNIAAVGSFNARLSFDADVFLYRDFANILAQRNGTNAQTFRVYNTHTSGTSFELGKLEWSSNVFRVGTEKGSGGGTARAMELQTDGTTRLTLAADGSTITVASGTNLVANHRLTGSAPASATATGTSGDVRSDADYIYICTATNTWKRAAITTW